VTYENDFSGLETPVFNDSVRLFAAHCTASEIAACQTMQIACFNGQA
jgi:hypothetical protein